MKEKSKNERKTMYRKIFKLKKVKEENVGKCMELNSILEIQDLQF